MWGEGPSGIVGPFHESALESTWKDLRWLAQRVLEDASGPSVHVLPKETWALPMIIEESKTHPMIVPGKPFGVRQHQALACRVLRTKSGSLLNNYDSDSKCFPKSSLHEGSGPFDTTTS